MSLWLFSLYLGASLAADAVDEVIQRIEELSPDHVRWEEEVEHGGVKLAEETMEWLSAGWATGVALFFAASWSLCAMDFVLFAIGRDPTKFVLACLFAALPLIVCYPVAATSSKCDDLLSALNTKSLRYVAYTWSALDDDDTSRSHRDTHLRLQALQQGLRQLNYDQVWRILPCSRVRSLDGAPCVGAGLSRAADRRAGHTQAEAYLHGCRVSGVGGSTSHPAAGRQHECSRLGFSVTIRV